MSKSVTSLQEAADHMNDAIGRIDSARLNLLRAKDFAGSMADTETAEKIDAFATEVYDLQGVAADLRRRLEKADL